MIMILLNTKYTSNRLKRIKTTEVTFTDDIPG